ncbi:MAG: ABC transporter ATP-binding protein [Xanthomonadales bacterium]|nr:ABC transporter ATP-binding protein [Xanthomonadales bacterium]
MDNPALELVHVGRRLAGRLVVDALDLGLRRGEVLGLLGVNGAGKSTTLRMMAGVLAPSSGSVRLDGEDLHEHPARARRHIGYLPEVPPLHAELTTLEYLRFCARLHAVPRGGVAAAVERAVERCDLGEVRSRVIGTLSKGWRQRIGIAQAIVHEPAVIILDEPASGLDPVQALKLRGLVRGLGRDHAVVVSTHVLPDVAACCDRVAILHRGVLRHLAPVPAAALGRYIVATARPLADATALAGVASAERLDARRWRVALRGGGTAEVLAAAVVASGAGLAGLAADETPLETTFLGIAGGEAAAA